MERRLFKYQQILFISRNIRKAFQCSRIDKCRQYSFMSKENNNNKQQFQDMPYEKLLKQVYYLDIKNRQLESRIAQLQPYKQREVKVPPIIKQNQIFGKFITKRYALKIAYVGINYDGLALQTDNQNTIEHFIFKCMHGLSLIQEKHPGKDYSRAGRTDKGVSAYGNVICLDLRTSIEKQPNETTKKVRVKDHRNGVLDYPKMLNSILPSDIRIMSAKEVSEDFNARYKCTKRSYKYFFAKNHLKIQLMQSAIKKFVGLHNFSNFCKVDLTETINFQKTIISAYLGKVDENIFQLSKYDERNQIYYFVFTANSFLWHQIRFMVTILFLIGSEKQKQTIIDDLLDVQKTPQKPNYPAAPEHSLILQNCQFNDIKFDIEKQDAINFYSTQDLNQDRFNQVIMKSILQLTLYIYCTGNIKMNAGEYLKFQQKQFLIQCKKEQGKTLHKKLKQLQFRKSTCLSVKDSIENLTGKKRKMYQKKQMKLQEYENRINQKHQLNDDQ